MKLLDPEPQERRPLWSYSNRWTQIDASAWLAITDPARVCGSAWQSERTCVISALYRDDLKNALHWHVSVSQQGRAPSLKDVARVLEDFGIPASSERKFVGVRTGLNLLRHFEGLVL